MKGKLAQLPEEMASLSISFNYFTDVISFQKILESPLEKKVRLTLLQESGTCVRSLSMPSHCACMLEKLSSDPWCAS